MANQTSYRACYFVSEDGQASFPMTGPEQKHLSDDALIEAAMDEAQAAGFLDEDELDEDENGDEPRMTPQEFRECLHIGDWDEG